MWNHWGNNPNVNEISLKYASYCPNFKISSIIGFPKLYYICIHTLQYYTVFLVFFCLWFTYFFFFFRRHSTDTSSTCIFCSLMLYSLLILLLLSYWWHHFQFNFLLIPNSPYTMATVYVFHILTIFYVLNIVLFSWDQSIKMELEFQLWHVNSLKVLWAQGKS